MPREKLSAGNFCKDHFVGRVCEGCALQRTSERSISIGRVYRGGHLCGWLCARNFCSSLSNVRMVGNNHL